MAFKKHKAAPFKRGGGRKKSTKNNWRGRKRRRKSGK